jgi:hypothetical protein
VGQLSQARGRYLIDPDLFKSERTTSRSVQGGRASGNTQPYHSPRAGPRAIKRRTKRQWPDALAFSFQIS